jgi:hypothetical protein
LDEHRAQSVENLPTSVQEQGRTLSQIALSAANKAMSRAPYAVLLYPIGRSIVNSKGRSFVPTNNPLPQN